MPLIRHINLFLCDAFFFVDRHINLILCDAFFFVDRHINLILCGAFFFVDRHIILILCDSLTVNRSCSGYSSWSFGLYFYGFSFYFVSMWGIIFS